MATVLTDATLLAKDYRVVAEEAGWGRCPDDQALARVQVSLVKTAEWTPEAATELVHLAQHYGSFVLRNALAIADALNIEDGKAGF